MASISRCMARWRCAVYRGPRPSWRGLCALQWPKAVIAATFDLHGNEDDAFLKHADMGFAVKYFPHYDEYLQGERAARMLLRAIRGDYKPVHAVRKVPIVTATVRMWTGASPWMDLSQRALVWEARETDVFVNVFFGFPFADVPDIGITVQVLTNDNPKLAEAIVRDIADLAWREREALLTSTKIYAIAKASRWRSRRSRKARRPSCWPITATALDRRPSC